MNDRKTNSYKVVVVGDAQSGKTSLLFRFIHGRFNSTLPSTIGATFFSRVLASNGQQYRVNMWDTAGQERFRSLIPMYLREIDLVLYVYDITNKQSFEHIKYWMEYVNDNATSKKYNDLTDDEIGDTIGESKKGYFAILVGNKTDLKTRAVSAKEGADLAKNNGIPFVETSVLKGSNVEEVWAIITRLLLKHQISPSDKSSGNVMLDSVTHKVTEYTKGCYGNCNLM